MLNPRYTGFTLDEKAQGASQEFSKKLFEKIATPRLINFGNKTSNHIKLVNFFANKIGYSFPKHDADKFGNLLSGYLYMYDDPKTLDDEARRKLDEATGKHVYNNPHHPEYWSVFTADPNKYGCYSEDVKEKLISEFRRGNPPSGLDCSFMDIPSIVEMCCDWAAVGFVKGNSGKAWADKMIGNRWIFSDEQTSLIYNILKKIEE